MPWLPRALTSSAVPVLLTAVGLFALLLSSDVSAADSLAFGGYLAVAVAFPGVFLWRYLVTRHHREADRPGTWFEDLTFGTILGFAIQLPVYLIGLRLGTPLLVLVLPVVTAGLSLTAVGRETWRLPTTSVRPGVAFGLGAVVLYGAVWLRMSVTPRAPLTLPANRPAGTDEMFHQALISELSHRAPPEIPFLLGTRLDYHWFVHAQMAATRNTAGIDSAALLRVVFPMTLMSLTVLGIAAVVLRLTRRDLVTVVAPAALVVGGFHLYGLDYTPFTFTESVMTARYVNSPSQAYGLVMSLPAVALILEALRPDRRPNRFTWVALTLALLGLSGSKATFIPIFLCGAAAVWLVHLFRHRRVDPVSTTLLLLLAGVGAFAQIVIFGGSTGAMQVELFGTVDRALRTEGIPVTARTQVAMTGSLLVGWLLYGAGAIGLLRARRWLDPRAIWLALSIAAGVTVAFVFVRSGYSQMWFQRSTAGLVVIMSAWGFSHLLPDPLTRRHKLTLGGGAALAGLLAFGINLLVDEEFPGPTATYRTLLLTIAVPAACVVAFLVVRWFQSRDPAGRRLPAALLVAVLLGLGLTNSLELVDEAADLELTSPRGGPWARPPSEFAKGAVSAGEWLEEHSDVSDIVATNVHCADPTENKCDNRSFWVSWLTERRIVVEGWGYTRETNDARSQGRAAYLPIPEPQRLEVNDAAFLQPSAETIGTLAETYGVSWLFVSKNYPADLAGLKALEGDVLERGFSNENYVVFQVLD